jgi:hypothetical protein
LVIPSIDYLPKSALLLEEVVDPSLTDEDDAVSSNKICNSSELIVSGLIVSWEPYQRFVTIINPCEYAGKQVPLNDAFFK